MPPGAVPPSYGPQGYGHPPQNGPHPYPSANPYQPASRGVGHPPNATHPVPSVHGTLTVIKAEEDEPEDEDDTLHGGGRIPTVDPIASLKDSLRTLARLLRESVTSSNGNGWPAQPGGVRVAV